MSFGSLYSCLVTELTSSLVFERISLSLIFQLPSGVLSWARLHFRHGRYHVIMSIFISRQKKCLEIILNAVSELQCDFVCSIVNSSRAHSFGSTVLGDPIDISQKTVTQLLKKMSLSVVTSYKAWIARHPWTSLEPPWSFDTWRNFVLFLVYVQSSFKFPSLWYFFPWLFVPVPFLMRIRFLKSMLKLKLNRKTALLLFPSVRPRRLGLTLRVVYE